MIRINLLPPDIRKSVDFRRKRLPIIPVLLGISCILVFYFVFLVSSVTLMKTRVYNNDKYLESIAHQKNDVEGLWNEVNELTVKTGHFERVIIPTISWAHVLNIISDYTSQGIWLSKLTIEFKEPQWLLLLSGFAKPVTHRSMIKDIGGFVTNIQENLSAALLEKKHDAFDPHENIEVATTTKRKKAQRLEVTKFNSTFKIKI